jgi:opacity protein-like surface antigen
MKKFLLAAALAVVFLTGVNAEPTPAGKGVYLALQAGGGKLFAGGGLQWYEVDASGNLKLKSEAGSGSIWCPSIQFNWGYSHRFVNDVTLGFEATVISPAVRLGYMINDKHHFALGVHYGLTSVFAINKLFQYIDEHYVPKEAKDAFSLNLDTLAGLGGSLTYECFSQSKNFLRVQFRADYYGVTAKVDPKVKLQGVGSIPFLVNGNGSLWDVYLAVGFGSQW